MDQIATYIPTHPLDALTAAEIQQFRETLIAGGIFKEESSRIGYVLLKEPEKAKVWAFRSGDRFEREITAVVYDKAENLLEHVCVNITTKTVIERYTIDQTKQGTAPFLEEELFSPAEIILADEACQKAFTDRGIDDFGRLRMITLSGGHFGYEDEVGVRVVRVLPYLAPSAEFDTLASFWGSPIEGLCFHLDVTNNKVLRLIDTGIYVIPTESGEIHKPEALPEPRKGLKPIRITQPEGVSFTLAGDEMSWQNWNFRIGFNGREGLTIHQVSYEDKGEKRPILHRASVAEMVVNYSDYTEIRGWQNYFDAGEFQFGRFVNSLELGCDCLGEIVYKDVTFADDFGNPVTVKNGICIHEEDFGVVWKHFDPFTRVSDVRRQRRLVVSTFLTAGNYDYGFFWYFYLDGKIELEVKANGLVVTSGYRPGEPHNAPLIAPDLASPAHQHLFNLRLDMMVDGIRNSVEEIEPYKIAEDRTKKIWGGAFDRTITRLKTEGEAQRMMDSEKGRKWRVVSNEKTNRLGQPTGYAIHTEGTPLLMADPDSSLAKRAAFATKSLWVTKWRDGENWPAGYVVNQNPGGDGLPLYASRNECVENEDIVVWHTFGFTHFPRPEDWPIMPCDYANVKLIPYGFFERNPALDVPAEKPAHCGHQGHCG